MAEATNIRVVRCPKCANFLPELSDYSLYQCGGCGAVLQGTCICALSTSASDSFLGFPSPTSAGSKSDEGDGAVVSGVLGRLNESRKRELGEVMKSESMKGDEAKEEMVGNRVSEVTVDFARVDSGKVSEKELGNSSDVVRSGAASDVNTTSSNLREVEDRSRDDSDRARVPLVEDDRAELLRKLDELKEQLSRAGLVSETPTGDARWSSMQDRYHNRGSYYSNSRRDPFPWQPKATYGYPYSYDSNAHSSFCTCNHCYHSAHPPYFVNGRSIQPHPRWGTGASDVNRFLQYNPRKVPLLSRGKICQPVAGGAPYITCSKCLEILKIPEKWPRLADKRRKVKCGGCSNTMCFFLEGNRLFIDSGEEDVSYPETRANLTFSSNDFDRSGYEFLAIDSDRTKASEMRSLSSSSSSLRETGSDREKAKGINPVPSLSGSPLPSCNDSASSISRLGKGSCSCRSDNDAVKVGARQNLNAPNDVATPTETEVSYTECSSTDARTSKGDSFFASFIKNFNLMPTSSTNQPMVRVNGHVIPDRQVKKAEKLAGPVHPGNYWYDSFAGFWGVTGGHCLGIIPAKIKEFNYPMEEKCSGGDTGVFVNGRELHKKDLDLLVSRGLPTERDRSYIIHVSGKVVDEDTGLELDPLGKLAPTIEKRKHGFGMKAPKLAPV